MLQDDDVLAHLNNDEKRFLGEMLGRLRHRDPWTRGHYAEVLVAGALPGALLSPHSAAPHDIEWPTNGGKITIAVRATGSYSMDHRPGDGKKSFAGTWKFPKAKYAWDSEAGAFVEDADGAEQRRCWADVVVLCRHDFDIGEGWTFHVLPRSAVETWPAETLRPSTVTAAGYPAIGLDDVADVVRSAAGLSVESPRRPKSKA